MNLLEKFDWTQINRRLGVTITTKQENDYVVMTMLKGSETVSDKIHVEALTHSSYSHATDLILEFVGNLHQRVSLFDRAHAPIIDHPIHALVHLSVALGMYHKMAMTAEKRGDVAGADAWRIAFDAVETAMKVGEKSGTQQTWSVR